MIWLDISACDEQGRESQMMAEHRIVASDDGERGSVPLLKNFACLAQRAGKHQLARRAWEKYLAAG